MNTEEKRVKEKSVIYRMITIYCKGHKHLSHKGGLCTECEELKDYAMVRTDRCPYMETKTFCSKCRVPCYKPIMKEQIRNVMRYSGPRLLIYHPILTIKHFVYGMKR